MKFKRYRESGQTGYIVYDSFPDFRNRVETDTGVEYGAIVTIFGSVERRRSQSPRTNATGLRWFFDCDQHGDGDNPPHGFVTREAAARALRDHYNNQTHAPQAKAAR